MGHGLDWAEVTVINGLIGETVKKAAHLLLIRRFNVPEPHFDAVLEGLPRRDICRI
jgi:hypothetical protein